MSQASSVAADLIEPADITLPLLHLHAGDVFVELLHDSVATRAATLDALLGNLAEAAPKLVWIGNPLRSPLTIERLFLQAAGPEADLRVERTPAELATMLQAALADTPRSLIIVQQPETLDPEARDNLARLAPLLAGSVPTIQFLFCGTSAFRPIVPSAAPPALPARAQLSLETLQPPHAAIRTKLPLLLLLALALFATVFASSLSEKPVSVAVLTPAEATTSPVPTPQPVPIQPAAVLPPMSPPATVDVVVLRREFDDFLSQQPSRASRLSSEQRNALFDEFLARQQRRPAPRP